jgi:hypothetical protein
MLHLLHLFGLIVLHFADLILVLKHGSLVERGTHDELLALNGEYASMWNRQAESQRIQDAIKELERQGSELGDKSKNPSSSDGADTEERANGGGRSGRGRGGGRIGRGGGRGGEVAAEPAVTLTAAASPSSVQTELTGLGKDMVLKSAPSQTREAAFDFGLGDDGSKDSLLPAKGKSAK